VIAFWTLAILVDHDGSLIAGTPEAPIGTRGGVVTSEAGATGSMSAMGRLYDAARAAYP
jgi:hypothetical protein